MPQGLVGYHQSGDLHFITFSCYHRQAFLASDRAKNVFEASLEKARQRYDYFITGYVVMPEHVHLLISEPERSTLASAIQAIKQSVLVNLLFGTGIFGRSGITTSMCSRKRSASRNFAISIATR